MMPMYRQKIASIFKRSTTPSHSHVESWFSPGWMMTLSVVQIITTMVLVSLFFIVHDLQQISNCVLYVKNFGYAQYDLVSLGLLIAGPIYQCILCLDVLFQRQACSLYAMLAFELWLSIYSGIQSKQHPTIIKEAATCQFTVNQTNDSAATFTTQSLINYSIVGVTCACFVLFLFLAIYFRTSFQQSMDPVHGALASLLKLDFYLVFAYGIQLLPVPLLMTSAADEDTAAAVVSIPEIVFVLGASCVVFLLAWSMVLVTWRPFSWWRIMLHMAGLAIVCLGGITYLCYRLIRFVLDSRTLTIRYALVFTSVYLIIVLLLTMSIVTTCAIQQWQTRSFPRNQQLNSPRLLVVDKDKQQQQKDTNLTIETDDDKLKNRQLRDDGTASVVRSDADNDDDICLFLTPQTSRINRES